MLIIMLVNIIMANLILMYYSINLEMIKVYCMLYIEGQYNTEYMSENQA